MVQKRKLTNDSLFTRCFFTVAAEEDNSKENHINPKEKSYQKHMSTSLFIKYTSESVKNQYTRDDMASKTRDIKTR